MDHAELHHAISQLVRRKFSCGATSTEEHPGRIDVQWTICVRPSAEGHSDSVYVVGATASVALERLKARLVEITPAAVPIELRAIGRAPVATDEAPPTERRSA